MTLLALLGATLGALLTACASTPEPAPVAASSAGGWLLVSCDVNKRGCRAEARFASDDDCIRARKAYDRDSADRQGACQRADD